MKQFYDKAGRLTSYSFACGYIEKKQVGTVSVEMYGSDSHTHYIVTTFDDMTYERTRDTRISLAVARRLYRARVRQAQSDMELAALDASPKMVKEVG